MPRGCPKFIVCQTPEVQVFSCTSISSSRITATSVAGYCRAKAFEDLEESGSERALIIDEDLPPELDFDLNLLYEFLKKDPAATLTFYGGEPLLRADLIERIVRESPVQRFMVQTNGLLLDRLPSEILNRFTTILVSLDGRESLTDANRGMGVYGRVMRNIQKIRANGYTGELIARMTITETTDIVDAVRYLASNPDYSFSSIHWQIDANFAGDFGLRRFREWTEGSYNPGISTLVRSWVDHMETSGEVPAAVPVYGSPARPASRKVQPAQVRIRVCQLQYHDRRKHRPCPVMIGMPQD